MRVFNLLELMPDYLREEVTPPCPRRTYAITRLAAVRGLSFDDAEALLDHNDQIAIDTAEALLATGQSQDFIRRRYS
jgi:hypothetical protein